MIRAINIARQNMVAVCPDGNEYRVWTSTSGTKCNRLLSSTDTGLLRLLNKPRFIKAHKPACPTQTTSARIEYLNWTNRRYIIKGRKSTPSPKTVTNEKNPSSRGLWFPLMKKTSSPFLTMQAPMMSKSAEAKNSVNANLEKDFFIVVRIHPKLHGYYDPEIMIRSIQY